MIRQFNAVLVTIAMVAISLTLAPPAQAEVGEESHSDATFLDATLLTGDLAGVVGIDGAHADFVDGTTPAPSVDDANLDTTALSLLTLPLPDLEVGVGDLLQLGAVQQYAEADPNGSSTAHTDTADLSLDLTQLLGQTPVLTEASLNLGAVGSEATLAGDGALTRTTTVADAALVLASLAIGTMVSNVNGAVTTLNQTVNGLSDVIETAVNDGVLAIVNAVGGITGTVNSTTTVTVNSRLDEAVSGLLDDTLTTDLISLDLATGTVTVDLAGGIDLNNIPPNSTLLSPEILQQVSADIETLLGQLQTDVKAILDNATDYIDITIDSDTSVTAPIAGEIASLDLDYSGTIADLLDGSKSLTATGTGLLAAVPLSLVTRLIQAAVGPAVTGALTTALTTAGTAVDTAVTGLTNTLAPALTGLGAVAQVNLNVQNESDGLATQADVTAVQVVLLPGTEALELNLATSSVGPNTQIEYAATVGATDTAAGEPTTVSGAGWPPNTEVSLQVTGPGGDPVGEPVTVTTTADGSIPADTTYPIPAGAAPGEHTISAATAGGTTATGTFQVVDTTAPDAPVIETPADGSTSNDTTPTVSGTGEPGATVDVVIDDTVVAEDIPVDADGSWSVDLTTPLTEGEHTVEATQTDPSGNTSPADGNTFTIDATAPDAPVIETPADGSTTSDPTPAISGIGEPGATVELTIDGTPVETAEPIVVAEDGTWSHTPTEPLGQGAHTVEATQTDPAGNTSPADSNTFTIDSEAPAAPEITGPADGSTIGDNTPVVTGTGEPGAEVEVSIDGTVIGTTTVTPEGTWSLEVTEPLADGDHTVAAVQTDAGGNTSPADSNDFTVDTTEEPPVITTPTSGSATSDNTPTIAGTGTPGSSVDVTITNPDGSTTVLEDVPVDDQGSWTTTAPTLPDGDYTVTATQTDPTGNTSPESNSVIFAVDTATPDAPAIETPADGSTITDPTPVISGTGEPGATVELVVDGTPVETAEPIVVSEDGTWSHTPTDPLTDGPHTVEATQTDAAGNTSEEDSNTFTIDATAPDAPVIETPADGSTISDPTPVVSGTGEPGARVELTIDGTPVETAEPIVVAEDGTWTHTPAEPLADGEHTVEATQTDGAGNASEADSTTFTIDATAPDAPVITSPADGDVTDDATPDITGEGTPGDTITVIIDGQPVGETEVGEDGTWTFTPTEPLPDGDHTVTATATDPAGNESPEATPVDFTVDTTAPGAPVITEPTPGEATDDNSPPISGTAEPGSTVEVTITNPDGSTTVIEDVSVDEDGSWSVTPTDPLAEGEHTVEATQTDEAGNTSAPSDPVTFEVDTVAPDAPVIETPADGSTITDPTPEVSGTGEPGATVELTIDGTPVETAEPIVVAEDGTWSHTPTDPLTDGPHTVEATQTDGAGNVSEADSTTFIIDATAPEAPVITGPGNGDTITDTTPEITGTGEPGATVEVTITHPDGSTTVIEDVPVEEDGSWSVTPTDPLPEGENVITATQTDDAGNTSGPSAPVTVTVDTTAPEPPVVTSPTEGQVTGDATPGITGTGEPGATVELTIDEEVVETAEPIVVGDDGTWTYTPTEPLTEGPHTVEATQTDEAGNTSEPSDRVTFEVDTTLPAVEITSPTPGELTNDPTPAITGTTEPGATITLVIDGAPVPTPVDVGPDGHWSYTPNVPLTEGEHTVVATATDEGGNQATDEVTFEVDATAPEAPVITGPGNGDTITDTTPEITGTGEPGATVEVTITHPDGSTTVIEDVPVEEDGSWSLTPTDPLPEGENVITATQTDDAGNTSGPSAPVTVMVDTTAPEPPVITSPGDGDQIRDTTPEITGEGTPGNTVTVIVDGETVGQVEVDEDGAWTFTPDEPLTEGPHEITATETDGVGNTSEPSEPVNVVVDSQIGDPTITSPTDGESTADDTPLVTGTGEPGATVTVIIDGQPVGTVVVEPDGTWQLQLEDPLADGGHTVTVRQKDSAGNVSDDVSVDFTVTPPAPVITSPQDGDTTGDNPVVTGTGEPGNTVTVYVDGDEVGTAVVDKDGTWSFPTSALECGRHTITASQSSGTRPAARAAMQQVVSPVSDPVTVDVACPGNDDGGPGDEGDDDRGDDGSDDGDGPDAGDLPDTGLDKGLAALAGIGLGLLVSGLLLLGRRRVGEH